MCISLLSIEIKYFPKDTWSQDAFHTDRKPHTTPWTLCPNKTPRATIIITKSQWARGSFWFCSFWKSREEMPKCPSAIVFLISTIKLRTGTHTKINPAPFLHTYFKLYSTKMFYRRHRGHFLSHFFMPDQLIWSWFWQQPSEVQERDDKLLNFDKVKLNQVTFQNL